MPLIAYEIVTQLAEQLTVDEQRSLISHLQERIAEHDLSNEDWFALLDSAAVNVAPGSEFSDSRNDWYNEDGR